MATAWLDERAPHAVSIARGIGRPLWLGETDGAVLFGSTVDALELVERYAGISLANGQCAAGSPAGLAPTVSDAGTPLRY